MTVIRQGARVYAIDMRWRSDPVVRDEADAQRYYRRQGAALFCFRRSGLARQSAHSTDPRHGAGMVAGAPSVAEMMEARHLVYCAAVTTGDGPGWWIVGVRDYAIYPATRSFGGGDVFVTGAEEAQAHLRRLVEEVGPDVIAVPDEFGIGGSVTPPPLGELLTDSEPRLAAVSVSATLLKPAFAGLLVGAIVLGGWLLLRAPAPAPPPERPAAALAPARPPPPPPAPESVRDPPKPRLPRAADGLGECQGQLRARAAAEDPAPGVALQCADGVGTAEAVPSSETTSVVFQQLSRSLAPLRIAVATVAEGKEKPPPGQRAFSFTTALPPEFWRPRLEVPWIGLSSLSLAVRPQPAWTVAGVVYGQP